MSCRQTGDKPLNEPLMAQIKDQAPHFLSPMREDTTEDMWIPNTKDQ